MALDALDVLDVLDALDAMGLLDVPGLRKTVVGAVEPGSY